MPAVTGACRLKLPVEVMDTPEPNPLHGDAAMPKPTVSELEESECVWPPWSPDDPLVSYYEWHDGIYAVIRDVEPTGPFETLDEAIRQTADSLTLVLRFGDDVLTRWEESSYGLYCVSILRYGDEYAVKDSVDDTSDGPFSSLDEAISSSAVLTMTDSTESITSTALSIEEIMERVYLDYVDLTSEKFVTINRKQFHMLELAEGRALSAAELAAARIRAEITMLLGQLEAQIHQPMSTPPKEETPAASFAVWAGRKSMAGAHANKLRLLSEQKEALLDLEYSLSDLTPQEMLDVLTDEQADLGWLSLDKLRAAISPEKGTTGKQKAKTKKAAAQSRTRRPRSR